mgnify:CR=1 FL=1
MILHISNKMTLGTIDAFRLVIVIRESRRSYQLHIYIFSVIIHGSNTAQSESRKIASIDRM